VARSGLAKAAEKAGRNSITDLAFYALEHHLPTILGAAPIAQVKWEVDHDPRNDF
jgi:hypothetical protein